MISVSFPSVAGALSGSRRRCNLVGICNNLRRRRRQLQMRTPRNSDRRQYLNHRMQDYSTSYSNASNGRISSSTPMNNSYALLDIERLFVLAKKRYRVAAFSTSPSSLPSNKNHECFEVTKITTETGEIVTIKMSQTEIMAQTTLSPRDLVSLRLTSKKERKLDWIGNTLMQQMRHPPTIMARNNFILLSLGPVRAVAERNAVYVFDVHNKAASSFTKYLSGIYQRRSDRIKNMTNSDIHENRNEEPTELVFLETVLADAVDSFTSRKRIFEPIVNDLLLRISTDEDFSDANLVHQMAPLMEQLKSFEIFVTQAYDCLTELLNDDEAMLQLLLTEQEEARKSNTSVDFERHQDVEHILGVYARRFSSIIQETNYLLGRIKSKQDFIELELDLYRNRLIRMNLDLAILATATGVTTALTGTFGMNMINGFEESATAFAVVSGGAAFTALSVGYYFRKMISGRVMQQRAEQRIDEIQTMSNAFSDMTALDYTVKKMMRGETMGKEEFKQQLALARQSKNVTDKEIDLLFNVLNTQDDDVLCKEDFMNPSDTKEKK